MKAKPSEQVTVRVDSDWVARMDMLAVRMSKGGLTIRRADIMRMCLAQGIETMEAKFGRVTAKGAKRR